MKKPEAEPLVKKVKPELKKWRNRITTARRGLYHLRAGGPRGLSLWMSDRYLQGSSSRNGFDPLAMNSQRPLDRPTSFPEIKVGVILDEFSFRAWGPEFTLVQLTPESWRAQLCDLDFILVESAWSANSGAWKYQLTGPNAPSAALKELLAACKGEIPTVFWNKEDPPHFEDFLETARLFDYVFTTDSDLTQQYREELGHDRVAVMSFAAQPTIHNPSRNGVRQHQKGDVAFGGSYFAHKFPERRQQLDLLLGASLEVERWMDDGLRIYSRFQGQGERYEFPARYAPKVVGSLSYGGMLTAYKSYKVFLNVNSVVDSPSMCARRIFELTASGTPVVSTPSDALPNFFGPDELAVAQDQDDAENMIRGLVLSPELRDRLVHRGQRKIWENHTYTHRAIQILQTLGIETERAHPTTGETKVSIVASTNRPQNLEHLIRQVSRQIHVDIELILGLHGITGQKKRVDGMVSEAGIENAVILELEDALSLGECLNRLVEQSTGEVVAKFDDDDYYAPNYLRDSVNALFYSGADVVGKEANYLYLESQGRTLLRNPHREHRFTTFVAGPTLVGKREAFSTTPFRDVTVGEDTGFLEDLTQKGKNIYSADRFNFLQVRRPEGHTWEVAEWDFLARGKLVGFGRDHSLIEA